MAILHDHENDISDYRERERAYNDPEDREISLGTGTILGMFFVLALLCAIFFGFGYSMGRRSVQTAIIAATPQTSTSGGIFSSFKPPAGSPAGSPVHAATNLTKEAQEDSTAPAHDPDSEIVTAPVTSSEDSSTSAKPAVRSPSPKLPAGALTTGRPTSATVPQVAANGTTMVQVAAVSHKEDADTLVAALKNKGYAVFIRDEPQDHLLHVQVGPFASHKDADAMRQHLLADGYNAIVK